MTKDDRGTQPTALPLVDEHTVDVNAGVDAVWDALVATVGSAFSGPAASTFARLVGCVDNSSEASPTIRQGSSLVGFRVVEARRPSLLVLTGRHRFSTYELRFTLEVGSDRTRLSAESRAAFPGVAGRAYRTAVISSGGHAIAVRRLLSGVAGRAATTALR